MKGEHMNKSDLITTVAARMPNLAIKDIEIIVNSVFIGMTGALMEGDRIEIRGFGSFEVRVRQPRAGRNPKTGQSVKVGVRRVPFFKVGKELRERIRDGA